MDCIDDWDQIGLEPCTKDALTASEWLSIGEIVVCASLENRWDTVQFLARQYYAQTGLGNIQDWQAMIIEIAIETAKDQAWKQGRLDGMELVMAASRKDDEALDLGSSVQYKDDMPSLIRCIPTNPKPRKHLQIKGQLGLYPEGRA